MPATAFAPRARGGWARWLHLPRWTVRLRFTLLYGGLVLVSGAGVIAITYWLLRRFLTTLSPLKTLGVTPGDLLAPGSDTVTFSGGKATPIFFSAPSVLNLPVNANLVPGTLFLAPSSQAKALVAFAPKQVAAQAALVHNDELHQLLVRSGLALAVVAVLAVGLRWLLAGRALRPLRVMSQTTQHISEENLDRRLALRGPRDELRDLGDTIDGLLGRLDGAFEAQRSFVANASHELRTPLTLARALLQMRLGDPSSRVESYRSTCEEVLAAQEGQERLIDSLLVLAKSQHGPEDEEPFDLAEVTGEVAEAYQARAASLGVTLRASLAPAEVLGDVGLVHRLVSNLIDNALRYNFRGGIIGVTVGPKGGGAELYVANSGSVVPAGELGRLLQPFQRLWAERGTSDDGLGLGLSIVAAVAKAHDASLDLAANPGGGLSVLLRFPGDRDRRAVPAGAGRPERQAK
jgi:signal transduction histidine kinase